MNKYKKKIEAFPIVNTVLMVFLAFITLYPIWYTIVLAFNDASDAALGGIYWWPREFSLESFQKVFEEDVIIQAFTISVLRTVIGTVTAILFTAMTAYAWSKKHLIGRNIYLALGTFTMFFNGGLIPGFINLKNLGLLDTFWVYIIPTMFNFFNLIIFTSFFRSIPESLEESAYIDGAHEGIIFTRIILPLSGPVLATISLFHGVWHWNDFFMGVIYVNNRDLEPIQTYLYRIITSGSVNTQMSATPAAVRSNAVNSTSLRLATMIVVTFPIVCVYPFLQKYFVQGMTVGSVKG
ncbi:carbohydrate ABC transporter permease [Thiospirochaeta perfilievii]|uniref:Carbohydrate ABC transporter permease n=1 Tax=Thiospirochaeta perfilievii TaxID=252967 RepID=A0A5C1QA99_9SPIO|nr:carbohydrate ABC transporter permease [Thiospirochaeta perfilievii]QEN04411.1 carbohydrate ABC transporter permease [Thiospirochaeta perfilievii]